ncbi:MAG: hypothetical protein QM737_02795 [Ferruginibacter sp.]
MNYQWKGFKNFKPKLARANELEDELKESIEKTDNCVAVTTKDKGAFSDYDLKITYPSGITVTVEVKEDKQVYKTGNIAVEMYRQLSTGIRPTCISISKADYFAYYYDNKFHFIKTATLRELLQDKTLYWETWGGDGGIARSAIFKREVIEGITEFIYTVTK